MSRGSVEMTPWGVPGEVEVHRAFVDPTQARSLAIEPQLEQLDALASRERVDRVERRSLDARAVEILTGQEIDVGLVRGAVRQFGERNAVDARCHVSRVIGVAHQRHDADQRKDRDCCCHAHGTTVGVTPAIYRRLRPRPRARRSRCHRRDVVRRRRRIRSTIAELLEAVADAPFGLGVEVRERAPEGLEVFVGRHGVTLGRWPTRSRRASWVRARLKRDLTVPTGTSIAAAISSYDRPAQPASVRMLRSSSESSASTDTDRDASPHSP